ncbi:MAG: signal peptidase II [Anaerolineae bacterium]
MTASGGTAASSSRGTALVLATAAAVVTLDQITKRLVLARLAVGASWPSADTALGRFFSFTHVQNTGVSFGMFQGYNPYMIVVALAVVVGVLVFRRHAAKQRRGPEPPLLSIATGLIVGGAIGNLVDRVTIGHVVDFLDFKVWPVFNVADSSVFLGVVALTLYIWHDERERAARAEAEADGGADAHAGTEDRTGADARAGADSRAGTEDRTGADARAGADSRAGADADTDRAAARLADLANGQGS